VISEAEPGLPPGLVPIRRTPVFDETTIPAGLRLNHRTAPGVWGVIRLLSGRLLFRSVEPAAEQVADPHHSIVIEPQQRHEVAPLGHVRFCVEFYACPRTAGTAPGGKGDATHG
jgi:tellurite resistance-related uncharacterized protein